MLIEVDVKKAIECLKRGEEVLAICGKSIAPLAETLEELRFLVDDECSEGMPTEEPEDLPEKEQAPKETTTKKQKYTASKEEEILKAWAGGKRSIKEIMEITGASYNTVRKYIPVSAAG